MTGKEIDKINKRYWEYCKNDGHKLYHLPFIIWLKNVAKINPNDYYGREKIVDEFKTFEGPIFKPGVTDRNGRTFVENCDVRFPEKIPITLGFDSNRPGKIIGNGKIIKKVCLIGEEEE